MIENKYDPDYKIPVAWLIEDYMEQQEWDKEDLSEKSHIPLQELSDILKSKIKLTEQSAKGLQKVFGLYKEIWLDIDRDYWRDK